MSPNTENWPEAAMHVLEELKRLSGEIAALRNDVGDVRNDVTNVRVEVAQKGATWGAISAAVVTAFGWMVKR